MKSFIGVLLLLAPLAVLADSPYKRHCSEDTCLQRGLNPRAEVKDVYTFQSAKGLEHRVIRYVDGSVVSILATPVERGICKVSSLKFDEAGPGVLRGSGCLKSEHQQPDLSIKVAVRAATSEPGQFLNRASLVIWRTGYDNRSSYHEIGSEFISFSYWPKTP